MGKAATLVAEIYDPLGLEGSIIRQSCENRWTDRHPSIYRLTWIFSPLLTNGIHMPGEIFISAQPSRLHEAQLPSRLPEPKRHAAEALARGGVAGVKTKPWMQPTQPAAAEKPPPSPCLYPKELI